MDTDFWCSFNEITSPEITISLFSKDQEPCYSEQVKLTDLVLIGDSIAVIKTDKPFLVFKIPQTNQRAGSEYFICQNDYYLLNTMKLLPHLQSPEWLAKLGRRALKETNEADNLVKVLELHKRQSKVNVLRQEVVNIRREIKDKIAGLSQESMKQFRSTNWIKK